ncbi:MAG: hypothetical protein AB8U25_06265 [Rickettsiales endosymbiont of Dermacentor nuttalli]
MLKPVLKLILELFWVSTGLITSVIVRESGLNIIMELGFQTKIILWKLFSGYLSWINVDDEE